MWLSITGMYDYDNTIFDGLELPSYTDPDNVVHTIDKDALINNILLSCAELEIVYPDISTMKLAIGVWAAAEYDSWRKLFASQMVTYNPIWNVDANETEKETLGRDISRRNEIDTTNTESVQGFNSSNWSEATKNHTVGDNGETINEDNERMNIKRRTGNIGVTATQDLIKKEREIAEFSIIEYITLSFKKRFCLLVY